MIEAEKQIHDHVKKRKTRNWSVAMCVSRSIRRKVECISGLFQYDRSQRKLITRRNKRGSIEDRARISAQKQRDHANGSHDYMKGKRVFRVLQCGHCGVAFDAESNRRKFCNHACSVLAKMKYLRPIGKTKAESERLRYRADPVFRLHRLIKRGLQRMIMGMPRSKRTEAIIGCTELQLKAHFESLFKQGMGWHNAGTGKGKWHIDHHVPKSAFDLTKSDQLRTCWHWRNLRPTWSITNLKKSDRINHLNSQLGLAL